MAEVTNAKAAVFNLFNIGSALLNAMTLCQLIKAIDDFNGKFGISGVGDILTLLSRQWQTLKTHQADGGFAFA
jgi:hypothetical protein